MKNAGKKVIGVCAIVGTMILGVKLTTKIQKKQNSNDEKIHTKERKLFS